MNNDYLQHYGVIGMRWGVRKARKKAQAENVKGRSKHSTGKNYDAFMKQDKKNKEEFNKYYSKKYGKDTSYNEKAHREVLEFNAKRRKDLSNAVLKDLDPKYINSGKRYIERGYVFGNLGLFIPKDA